MSKVQNDADSTLEQRTTKRAAQATPSHTAITSIGRNRILLRGYPVDEAMGRVTYAEAVYLLLMGELPTAAIGKLMEAILVSSIDHGATPPSTLAARNVATTGAPLRASVAAGILAFGKYHGADIEDAMRMLEAGVTTVRNGMSFDEAARALVDDYRRRHEPLPGFGHRLHTNDPRAARLFQMALELDLDGPCLQMCRTIERLLNVDRAGGEHIPINVDGAVAAVCCDIGFPPELGQAFLIISRVPGLVAQAYEEQIRERPMRSIDATGCVYDGPGERRLPDTRR